MLNRSTSWLFQKLWPHMRLHASLANSQKIATDKWPCTDQNLPFFANYILIFHKTEIQTIILRCITCLNLYWFKNYGLRCNLRPKASSVSFQKIATDKWPFYNQIWSFFVNHMVIFHKTEIQTVILKCLMSLNLNWHKSYDTKRKNSKNANLSFWKKLQKNGNKNFSVLCYNFWTNQNLDLLRPVKHVKMTVWTSVL